MEKYTLESLNYSMSEKAVKAATKGMLDQINKIRLSDDHLEINIIFPCSYDTIIERVTISDVKKMSCLSIL